MFQSYGLQDNIPTLGCDTLEDIFDSSTRKCLKTHFTIYSIKEAGDADLSTLFLHHVPWMFYTLNRKNTS
jgi:hypothetical protein